MSVGNPERFPWGPNTPGTRARIIVATVVAVLSAALATRGYFVRAAYHSDFSIVWAGARALFHGANPYTIVGPGLAFNWDYPLLYPATSFVAVAPLTVLPEIAATAVFVFVSSFALVYGMTRSSWHHLPILASIPYGYNVRVAQWGMLVTASIFVPSLAGVIAVKPQAELPVIFATPRKSAWSYAVILSLGALGISLALRPTWPLEWVALLENATSHMAAPITRPGGFVVLLLLLRWRRAESWLVLTMACMPQTWDSYNVLPLLTIAGTYREAAVLSLISSAGAIVSIALLRNVASLEFVFRAGGVAMLAYAYIPAVVVILRRPPSGPMPAWLHALVGFARSFAARSP